MAKRSRVRRWVLIGGGVVAGLVVVGVIAVPLVAGAVAPGIIEKAANGSIAGTVKVSGVSVGWFGPVKVGSIELYDEKGVKVGTFSVRNSLGIFSALGGLSNLGETTVSGNLDVKAVTGADGVTTTNFERAVASKGPAKPPTPKTGTPTKLPAVTADVKIDGIDVTYAESDASGKVVSSAAINGLKGTAHVATTGGGTATLDLSGALKGADAASNGTLKVAVKADSFVDSAGAVSIGTAKVDASVDASGLPMKLVDALAGQKGVLAEAVGPTATAQASVKGTIKDAAVAASLAGSGASADVNAKISGGRLVAEKPIVLDVKSTAFAAKMPSVKDALAKAGMQVDSMGELAVTVAKLDVPMPAAGGGSAASAGGGLDLRGAAIDVTVNMGEVRGSMANVSGEAGAPRQAFVVAPTNVHIAADDLAKGASVTAGTSATIDGQSAGTLSVKVAAASLLDASGQAKRMPTGLAGEARASGVSTALVKPIVSAMKLPVDVTKDVGPTADVAVTFKDAAGGNGGAGGAGATAVELTLTTANVKASAPLVVSATEISASAPVTLSVASATPMAQRVLDAAATSGAAGAANGPDGAKPAKASVALSGAGSVSVEVPALRVPMKDGKPDIVGITATVNATLADVTAALSDGQTVKSGTVKAGVVMTPGKAAQITMNAAPVYDGQGVPIAANVAVSGLPGVSATAATNAAALPGLGTMRANGTVNVGPAPAGLVQGFVVKGGETPAMADVERGLLDKPSTVTVTLAENAGGQDVKIDVAVGEATASVPMTLKAGSLDVGAVSGNVHLSAQTLAAVLKVASAESVTLTSGGTDVAIATEALSVPLTASGGVDAAKAGDAALKATVRLTAPVTVAMTPAPGAGTSGAGGSNAGAAGAGGAYGGGLSDFTAAAVVPLKAVVGSPQEAGSAKVSLKASGSVVAASDGSTPGKIGELSVDATAAKDLSTLDASVGLTKLDTARADAFTPQQKGLVSGALGDTASVTVTAKRGAKDQPIDVKADIDSPKLSAKGVAVAMDQGAVRLTGPMHATWAMDPAFADAFVLSAKDASGQATPATLHLASPAVVTMDVKTLAVSMGSDAKGVAAGGLFKPGVFALDATVSVPSVAVVRPGDADAGGSPAPAAAAPSGRGTNGRGGARAAGGAAPASTPAPLAGGGAGTVTSTLEGITLHVASAEGNVLNIDGQIAKITDSGQQTGSPATVKASVKNFADASGAVQAKQAVVSATVAATKVPTAIVDQLTRQGGQLVKILGPQLAANVDVKDFTQASGGNGESGAGAKGGNVNAGAGAGGAIGGGSVSASVTSDNASLSIAGPIVNGVLDTTGPGGKPLDLELKTFQFSVDTKVLQMLPLFASAGKAPGDKPSSIVSKGLKIPIDGDMSKLNGEIDVDLGKIVYDFQKDLGEFLDSTIFAAGGKDQPAIAPFAVHIVNGVATYDKFAIPVRQFSIATQGSVDLKNDTIDVVTLLPTLAASKSLLSTVNKGLGSGFGKVLPDVITEGTMIPLRTKGPLASPSRSVDFKMMAENFGSSLVKAPGQIGKAAEDVGKGIGGLIGGLIDKDKNKDKGKK